MPRLNVGEYGPGKEKACGTQNAGALALSRAYSEPIDRQLRRKIRAYQLKYGLI